MDTNILYEDDQILIVEKEAIVPSYQKGSEGEELLKSLREKHQENEDLYPEADEVLNSPIGGAAVFAKTPEIASYLSQDEGKSGVTRKYRAIVRGKMPKDEDTLTDHLLRKADADSYDIITDENENSVKGVLHYKVIGRDEANDLTLMEIEMEKGYSYHIRVQLANVGNVLHGDTSQGQHFNKIGQPIALWSHTVSVKHPDKDDTITVESTPADEVPWNHFY